VGCAYWVLVSVIGGWDVMGVFMAWGWFCCLSIYAGLLLLIEAGWVCSPDACHHGLS
jgi:hypothetical protein